MPGHSLDVLGSLPRAVPPALVELAEAWDPATAPAPPRAAASVVLCRDGADGLETFLLHRHARMAFAASVAVFPGGGVDPVDRDAPDPLVACAIRETREETGVELLAESLSPWAHWITPAVQPIRYDTAFYVAALPAGQTAADLSTETDTAGWTAPVAALAAAETGALALMPPTRSILLELARCDSTGQVLAAARDRVIEPVLPEVLRTAAGWVFGYPRPTQPTSR